MHEHGVGREVRNGLPSSISILRYLSNLVTLARFLRAGCLPFATIALNFAATALLPIAIFAAPLYAQPDSSQTKSSDADERIHLGDLLEVDVVGSTEFDWRGEVSPEGFLAGVQFTEEPVFALCRTPSEVAELVRDSYKKFLNGPVVRVTILDRSGREPATLYGAVRNQHRFRLRREVSLRELLIIAGGLTSEASGRITILRKYSSSCENGFTDTSLYTEKVGESVRFAVEVRELLAGASTANPRIGYGDVITVEETAPVYLMGGIAVPSKIPYRDGMTLSRAIDAAGGLAKKADPGRVTIFRREGAGRIVIKASIESIREGDGNDIPLAAYDIVDVAQDGAPDRRYAPLSEEELLHSVASKQLPIRVID